MEGCEGLKPGQRFRVTRQFTAEFLDDVILFDGGLHHPITVPEGTEGIVHALGSTPNSGDFFHRGYFDARYPELLGWPSAKEGGVRVETDSKNIELL